MSAPSQCTSPGESRPASGLWWLCLALVAVVLTILSTWPSVGYFSTRLYKGLYSVDAGGGLWWPHAFVTSLLRGDYPFQARSLAWPEGQDVTPLVWNCGVPLLFAPIYALARPILAANLVALSTSVLNSLAAAWAARALVGTRRAQVAAVVVAATSPYAWIEAGSGRQDQALWAPIAIYLAGILLVAWRRAGRWERFAAAASLAAAGAIYWFYAYFLIVLTLGLCLVLLVLRRVDAEMVKDLLEVGVGAFLLVSPFLAPVVVSFTRSPGVYWDVARHLPAQVYQQVAFSLTPACFSGLLEFGRHDGNLQAPLLLLPVLLWGVVRGRGPVRALSLLGLAAACLACGPYLAGADGTPVEVAGRWLALPMMWLRWLPGFQRFWWPYRWMAVALPAFAVVTGWVVGQVRAGGWAVPALAMFMILESAVLLRLTPGNGAELWPAQTVPPVFASLAGESWPSPVLHLPLGVPAFRHTVWQAFHEQPIDTGLDWHIPGVMSPAYRERLEHVPLMVAIARVMAGEPVHERPVWSPRDTAGFCYVLLPVAEDPEGEIRRRVTSLLGPPDYTGCQVVVWHVPGMGRPLQGVASPPVCVDPTSTEAAVGP